MMPGAGYRRQDRGAAAAYEAYFAGMDTSVQQKVALTTAYFPTSGVVADMGSGSGRGTYDLACLYPDLRMIGVDINPVSVRRSSDVYRRNNLGYLVGDIAVPPIASGSLDGILDSSVLHHVTSFNGFSTAALERCLDRQVVCLKEGGVIIVRDFVAPDGPEEVLLELPTGDGSGAAGIEGLSTAELFQDFARCWRSSHNRSGPVAHEGPEVLADGWHRYRVSHRAAVEFVLRKDYRRDWATELLEEYTYFTQAEFERAFESRGLRLLCSVPLRNPWIVKHRFVGQFRLRSPEGAELPCPPTNYLIVGQKVGPDEGVRFVPGGFAPAPSFLNAASYRHEVTGRVFDLVERPGRTIDLLPWRRDGGRLLVTAKQGFPRPVVKAAECRPDLARLHQSGYLTEPVAGIVRGERSTYDAILALLQERARISPDAVLGVSPAWHYYTSPGGLDERVSAYLVKVSRPPGMDLPHYGDCSTAGRVRELDARQVLRSCHVGGMVDARLELNILRLLSRLGESPGPWIGAEIRPEDRRSAPPRIIDSLAVASNRPYAPIPWQGGHLRLRARSFVELAADGRVLSRVAREYVEPVALTANTVTVLPLWRHGTRYWVGLERRDLPAAQNLGDSAETWTLPAWRLGADAALSALEDEAATRLREDFSLCINTLSPLGGPYFPTPGVTPELVIPYVADASGSADELCWISLEELVGDPSRIRDAHLAIAALRLGQAIASD